jgi:hypothetical protein
MKCDHLYDSGPYVLGALSPSERVAYEAHLGECPTCRAEVADLAALPGLLGRLDLPTARAVAAGGEDAMHAILEVMPSTEPDLVPEKRDPLLPRVLERAEQIKRTERRRRRVHVLGSAVAAAVIVLAVVFGIRVIGVIGQPPLRTMHAVAENPPVDAKIAMADWEDGGTEIHMRCRYKVNNGEGQTWLFRLVAIPKRGDEQELSQWTAGYEDEYDLTGHTVLRRDEILRVEIRDGYGQALLVYDVSK